MENNRSLWKKVLKIAGIVVLVLLLAFGGLVAYAYYTYKKDNSCIGVWYYADELPLICLVGTGIYSSFEGGTRYQFFQQIYGCCYTQGYQRFVVHKQAQRVPACCWLLR